MINNQEEQRKYDVLNNSYTNIHAFKRDNVYEYKDFDEQVYEPIEIGSMCEDEYRLNTGTLTSHQKWNVDDTLESGFLNAQRLYNKIKFDEDTLIRSDEIEKRSGLALKIKEAQGFFDDNANYFSDVDYSSLQTDFNVKIKSLSAIELFGYFTPDVTGQWTFQIPTLYINNLWISNDHALYDFTKDNADISKVRGSGMTGKSTKLFLKKGEYYSLRLHLCNTEKTAFNGPLLKITSPSNQSYTENKDFQFFNTLISNGEIFMKKLFYFGFTKNQNANGYQCHFVDSTSGNYNVISNLKSNLPLIIVNETLPTALNYVSNPYNEQARLNDPVNVQTPIGSQIQVQQSRWGLDKDRVENQRYTTQEKYNPGIASERAKLYKNVPYQYNGYNNFKGTGAFMTVYDGNWGENINWFSGKKPVEARAVGSIGYNYRDSGAPGKVNNWLTRSRTYVFECDCDPKIGWHIQFMLESNHNKAVLYTNKNRHGEGGKLAQTTRHNDYYSGRASAPMFHESNELRTIKVIIYSGNGDGVRLHWRHRYKQRRGWGWGGWEHVNSSPNRLNATHNVKVLATKNGTKEEKITPEPTKTVWNDNWVTIPSSVDTKMPVSNMVQTSTLNMFGNYNDVFGDPAKGFDDKWFRLKYGFTQDLSDSRGGIEKKNIFIDKNGQLVFEYDYYDKTSKQAISNLTRKELCKDPKKCEYELVLEDDGSISIYNDKGEEIWNKQFLEVDVDKLEPNEDWLRNPARTNTLSMNDKLLSPGMSIENQASDTAVESFTTIRENMENEKKDSSVIISDIVLKKHTSLGVVEFNNNFGIEFDLTLYNDAGAIGNFESLFCITPIPSGENNISLNSNFNENPSNWSIRFGICQGTNKILVYVFDERQGMQSICKVETPTGKKQNFKMLISGNNFQLYRGDEKMEDKNITISDKIKSGKGYIYTSEKIVSDEYEIPDNINGIVANARIQNLKLVTSENPITLESLAPSLKLIKGKGLLRGVKQVVSNNGKFKLHFMGSNDLTLTYCKKSYSSVKENNKLINFTTNEHVNNSTQILYLYRIPATGLMGKKALIRTNTRNDIRTMEIVPNDFNKVFEGKSFTRTDSAFPLLTNSDYQILGNSQGSVMDSKYSTFDATRPECQKSCLEDENCQHFFHMNTRTGGKCMKDVASNSIVIYSNDSNSNISQNNNISTSNMYKKNFNINTGCGINKVETLSTDKIDNYSDYQVLYGSSLENDPNKTYYCSSKYYQENKDTLKDTYNSKSSILDEASQSLEGFRTFENFSQNCGTVDCIANKVDNISAKAKNVEVTQQEIANRNEENSKKFSQIVSNMKSVNELENNSSFFGNEIPDIYKRKLTSNRPDVDQYDGLKKDAKALLMHENVMYTIGTLSAATIIITAIILARE